MANSLWHMTLSLHVHFKYRGTASVMVLSARKAVWSINMLFTLLVLLDAHLCLRTISWVGLSKCSKGACTPLQSQSLAIPVLLLDRKCIWEQCVNAFIQDIVHIRDMVLTVLLRYVNSASTTFPKFQMHGHLEGMCKKGKKNKNYHWPLLEDTFYPVKPPGSNQAQHTLKILLPKLIYADSAQFCQVLISMLWFT